jgi:AmiR/NasT family two-component response regulator
VLFENCRPVRVPTLDKSVDPVQLRKALERLPVIEQAEGIVMLLCACSADEAFDGCGWFAAHQHQAA